MRILACCVLAAALSACESTGASPDLDAIPAVERRPAPTTPGSLPAQRLEPGQCGLFLFGPREPFPFVLFEDEAARQVSLIHNATLYELGVPGQGAPFVPGESFRRVYLAAEENLTFTLEGTVGQDSSDGQRLEGVILTARQLDGTRTVRPLAGVRRCNDA